MECFMTKDQSVRLLIFFAIGILTILLVFFTVSQAIAQEQNSNDLSERLKQKGVPVIKVVTISRLPYEIEINLQSASENEELTLDDNRFIGLAHHEAAMAYRIGPPLKSYRLNVYNSKDKLLYSTDTYLYSEDLSQNIRPGKSTVDAQTARQIVAEKIQLSGLSLDELSVTEAKSGEGGQVLVIKVSGKDLEEINRSLPGFLTSVIQMLDTINSQRGTNIVFCHMRVVDETGEVLLDYVRDLEGGNTQWMSAKGVYNDWFPKPAPASLPVTPTRAIEKDYPVPSTAIPYP